MAWVQKNIIRGRNFWNDDLSSVGSWIWKRLIKLRDLARLHFHCNIQSGEQALFWFDNWISKGPLIQRSGASGPLVTGININATVAEATANGVWLLPRGRHPVARLLRSILTFDPPSPSNTYPAEFLWRNGLDDTPGNFSTSKTWAPLHPPPPLVSWHPAVWFKQRIPKHAFISWLVQRGRLNTKDRLRSWGLQVPPECLLCNSAAESLEHIFYSCPYSAEVWSSFFHHQSLFPPLSLADITSWVVLCSPNAKLKAVCLLIFQATQYFIWIERNSRLHSGHLKHVPVLIRDIQFLLRAKMASLDRLPSASSHAPEMVTFLTTRFTYFQR